ncbi:Sodium-dependent phosphate transporter [hydrothermal vent metagenome]|uniref:Sodium-dependent phosphate transporter n=1 Tax=hydrothermal vent metagenome TaxID=652676 RepID=A0A3B1DLZ7_9ZZZZ
MPAPLITLNNSLLPSSQPLHWLRKLIYFCAIAPLLWISVDSLWGADEKVEPTNKTQKQTSAKEVSSERKNATEGHARETLKIFPDIKILYGIKTTRIDLPASIKYEDGTPFAKEGETLNWEVTHNKKKKVAEVEIDEKSNQLVFSFKKLGKTELRLKATNSQGKIVDTAIHVAVWKADYWKLIMTVIGGLGIFLLGMKNMSEGLQAVAGNGLRRVISLITNNRLMAVGVGTGVTMVVQSSTITTVMVVGFVNSGFMTLSQAVGVIMGANIGTTITGWVLALKIGKFGLPIIGVCVFGWLFSKSDRVRFLLMFGMGLGMVFLGLETMKSGFSVIKNLPAFEAWFKTFSAETFIGRWQCALIGCLLTFIVQSSSATLGITIALAQIGVIPFETAAALVMGENIGTTITAWLASFGTTTNAKRAAYFHVLFNVIGVMWILTVFPYFLPLVKSIVGMRTGSEFLDPTVGIATAHSCFNIVNTIMFIPFAGFLAKFLEKVVPDKGKETPHLTSLDIRMLDTPVMAIEQSRVEILRMAEGCQKMMDWLKEVLSTSQPSSETVRKLFNREEVLDNIQDEIVVFMTDLLSGSAPHEIVEEARQQLRMADEYESVSDYITSIVKFQLKLENQGHQLDDSHRKSLLELHELVAEYLAMITTALENRQTEIMTKARSLGDALKKKAKVMRDNHIEELSKSRIEPNVNLTYTSTLNSYRRVRDHALNIAEAIAGEK